MEKHIEITIRIAIKKRVQFVRVQLSHHSRTTPHKYHIRYQQTEKNAHVYV